MNVRHTVLTCAGVFALTAACSESSAGPPPLPSCGARGTQLSLAVAAYTSLNPATDSGCVTFAANTAADTAEYLVLPWSGGGTPGSSAPFALQSTAPVASISLSRFAPGGGGGNPRGATRSEEHTSELQSRPHLVCRLLLEKKKKAVITLATYVPATPNFSAHPDI